MEIAQNYIELLKNITIGGNTGFDYLVAAVVFIGLLLVLKIIKSVIIGRLRKLAKKTKNDLDDTLIEIFSTLKPPFYFFIALYISIRSLSFPDIVDDVIRALFLIAIVYEVIRACEKLVDYAATKYLAHMDEAGDTTQSRAMVRAINVITRVVLWLIGITLILANMGVNVTSVVASLGIGGLAIGLALQNILGDIFSSFALYLDKPFRIGDFIVVGEHSGTVEHIGLKSTRIRTLQGQELVVSNNELTAARVENYKRMEQRRVAFDIGVVYELKPAQIEKIPEIVKGIVDPIEGADFDRCHFKSYGDSALIYEIVYFVQSADYNEYMDINQEINLGIFNAFAKEKIGFAYPTQTVYVQK